MSTIKDFSFDEAICLLQDLRERPGVEEALFLQGFQGIEMIPAYYDRYLTFLHDPDHPANAHLIREGFNPLHPALRPYNPALWEGDRMRDFANRKLISCRAICHV